MTEPLTPMGEAAQRASRAPVLQKNGALTYTSASQTFAVTNDRAGSRYSVTDGKQTAAQSLAWVFGSGEFGQTFLYEAEGDWHESRVSYYKGLNALDLTTGHPADQDASLSASLGRVMQGDEAPRCFACHTTMAVTDGRFDPQRAVEGLGCEACHGPGQAHVVAMEADGGQRKEAKLMDLAALSPAASVDFCGSCHRTWADVAFDPRVKSGADVVRFQPYRLEQSRCWGAGGDARITCVACHDPHRPLERDDSVYDRQCQTCHRLKSVGQVASKSLLGKACPVSTARCTTCHMPKISVASMHGAFTDHWIRVVRLGEDVPR